MKTVTIALVAASFVFAGCASSTSPVKPQTSNSGMSFGQLATAGVTAGVGAAIGHKIDPNNGAAIGAATGALVGAVGAKVAGKNRAQELAEAEEEARRQERLKIMNDYWQDRAVDTAPADGSTTTTTDGTGTPKTQTITYPAGVYEGVYYGPRTVTVPATR